MAADRQVPPTSGDRSLRFDRPLAPQLGILSRPILVENRSPQNAKDTYVSISLPRLKIQEMPFYG